MNSTIIPKGDYTILINMEESISIYQSLSENKNLYFMNAISYSNSIGAVKNNYGGFLKLEQPLTYSFNLQMEIVCEEGYYGNQPGQCELFNCSNLLFNDSLVCSAHGSCSEPNNCTCNEGYHGDNCQLFNCSNFLFNDPLVCSGSTHGSCLKPNNCTCNEGYYGDQSELFNCSDYLFSYPLACSGHGSCSSPNNCTCNEGYYGSDCSQFKCNDIFSTQTQEVCSTHGNCTAPEICNCTKGYTGTYCERIEVITRNSAANLKPEKLFTIFIFIISFFYIL